MPTLSAPRRALLALLLLPLLALTACDSGRDEDNGPVAYPGDPRLLGMWAGPDDGDGYQDFIFLEYDEDDGLLRSRRWEHDQTAGCFELTGEGTIPAANITPTTLRDRGGSVSTYAFSDGGSTLTITDSTIGPQVLTRSSRTPESMTPLCP